MNESLDYLLTAQLNDGSEVVLDPDTKGWADPELLAKTKIWSLVSRLGDKPVVTVTIPENGKPVYKSRVYGKLQSPIKFRAYAIGYKLGPTTHWVWVMPHNNIEFGEDPHYADLYLKELAGLTK